MVAITSLEVHLVPRGDQPVTGSLLAFGLLNINIFLLLLFTFLIFRHLSKLFLERRRKVFGSRLRTRLVLTFISLTLLPTLFLFIMAWQLISSRVDHSWDRQVEQSLDQALDLSRTYSLDLEDKLKACGRLFSLELKAQGGISSEQREALQAFVDRNREAFHLSGLEILDPDKGRLADSFDPQAGKLPGLPAPEAGTPAPGEDEIIRQKAGNAELLSWLGPVPRRRRRPGRAMSWCGNSFPRPICSSRQPRPSSLQDLRRRHLLFSPVKVSHYLTLIIVTLVAMMAAIWLAFYMAREITIPIRQLAEGTLKVAGGDYDIHIDQEGRDEIGFLVQSFNKMTQDLQQSQAQLAAAYQQLSDSPTN